MTSDKDAPDVPPTDEPTDDLLVEDEAADDVAADDEPGTTAKTPRRRLSKLVLVAAGVGVIGLLAGGGIGYAVGHSGSGSTSPTTSAGADLALPDTLSGGLERSSKVDSQIEPSLSSAQKALGAGTDMALYTKGKTQVLVEATRLPGDALLQAGMTYTKDGDAVCVTSTASSGAGAVCVRSTDALTVKVTAATPDTAAKYADELFSDMA